MEKVLLCSRIIILFCWFCWWCTRSWTHCDV